MLICQCVTTLISINSRPIHIELDSFFLKFLCRWGWPSLTTWKPNCACKKTTRLPTTLHCARTWPVFCTCTYCPKAANHAISPKTAVPLVTKDGILPLFKFRLILQTIVFIIGMFRSEYNPHKCGFSISRSITPNHGSDQPGLWTVASLSISRLFEWCLFTHCSWPLEKAGIKWLHLIPYQKRVPI